MYEIYLFAILLSPFFLLITYIVLAKNKSFKKIFVAYTIILITYILFIVNYSKLLTGHDEYGLGKLGLEIMFVVIHIILGLFLNYKKRNLYD